MASARVSNGKGKWEAPAGATGVLTLTWSNQYSWRKGKVLRRFLQIEAEARSVKKEQALRGATAA